VGDLTYSAPTPLEDAHRLDDFACDEASLESWLKRRARKNHSSGASRVFVVTVDGGPVVGYYALSAGSVVRAVAPGRVSRNMPEPIPVAVLGRLAVHRDHGGRGLGAGLLRDAVLRTERLSRDLGVRVLLCHAVDERARAFYLHHGFLVSPIERLTLMLPLGSLAT
jgi:GNAT superfamily N-acetyltransferase